MYIIDAKNQLLVWLGDDASQREKNAAFNTASWYLRQTRRPMETPVSVLKQGSARTHPLFKKLMCEGHSRKSLVLRNKA